ncbi:MAG: 1-acyl-sn-glycerol-3-phosphate acyltransferase [Candidatus Thalassarchaeaceae archaeon]|jgi:1-acyl-sn-glycerol-3-phosphate acyltransferase|nr:1-acyl-sn-glycerol-3-phosphate acyltransferase [Candidatus Thalassarchaeaceae archaeon]
MTNNTETQVQSGADGAVDHHGEILPELSKRASRINISRIEASRRIAKTPGGHPGTGWFYDFMNSFARRAFRCQFRTVEITGTDNISNDAGMLTVAWHTNALIDPMCISVTQSKRLVFGGRHDMITRPIIGPIASRMGSQPVIRQAELARGGTSSEAAARINGKTMLTLAECIAHGHASALFPEGTSHEDSQMRRLRTGPMRSVIAAHSISVERGLPEPHMLPVGLHFRVSWHFRTDAWIEYGPPISLTEFLHAPEDRQKLIAGEWVEAPSDAVNTLRNRVSERLKPMTPDAESWNQHRAWHVLGHARALAKGNTLDTWREEVLAARDVRELIRSDDEKLIYSMPLANRISNALDDAGLDGRSLSSEGIRTPRMNEKLAIIPAILLAILSAPLTLFSSGVQIIAAKILGDNTDEGRDARPTFHILFALLGPLLIWPFPAMIIAIVGYYLGLSILQVFGLLIASPITFSISNKIALIAWDNYVIARNASRIGRFSSSSLGKKTQSDAEELLAVLK